MSTPVAGGGDARLRLTFVLWSGAIGGAETLSAALARVLRASGVETQVVTVTRAEPLAERLRQDAIPFVELGYRRGRAALWHPRRFAGLVERAGPDGAILVSSGFMALALRLGGYRGRIAAVEHGSILQTHRAHRRSRPVDRLDRLLGSRAVDVRVAVSGFLRDHLPSSPRPTVVIPNGVDLDLYRPSPSPRSKAGGFVIGCMSRLFPGKGVEDVLVAARAPISRGARLRIAGDGPVRPELERLAEQLGIQGSVSFDGWIRDAAEVAAFWRDCKVAIAAPNDWVESFGLSAVEAMACGRPVVATRSGALAETIVEGETGFLAEPRDTQALASALLRYMEDDSLLAAHSRAARARCEQHFDIRRCAAAYAGLFTECPGPGASKKRPDPKARIQPGQSPDAARVSSAASSPERPRGASR